VQRFTALNAASCPQRQSLKNAPHTTLDLVNDQWNHPYSRKEACTPTFGSAEHKYWPPVNRVDNAFGDRNLMCTRPPLDQYDNGAE
jgi:glycine dehydrogenase